MSAKSQAAARAAARRTARSGQRSGKSSARQVQKQKQSRVARVWKAASANPLVVALLAVLFTAGASIPTTLVLNDSSHQGAANEATIQANQEAEYTALSHDADLVDFGLGTNPHSSSPEVVIENRSSGWIRNLMLFVPIPGHSTANSDGSTSISVPSFNVYWGGSGYTGLLGTPEGIFLDDPLPDIEPCELAVSAVVKSLPSVTRAALANSELIFTDANGNAWIRFGSGKLERDTGYKGPGTWSPYEIEEPVPGCSAG